MATVQNLLKQQGRGTMSAIARALKLTPGAVRQWKAVPPQYVARISEMTGISKHELRPDVFGPAPKKGERQ